MKILALDSSTLTGSAAVLDGGAVLAESTARVRAGHAEQMLPLVQEVLARAELTLADIARVAVGVGPGSFTGVRIAVATAKGLCLGAELPLYGVVSLDALAESAWALNDGVLVAALDARRGELFAAAWRARGGERDPVMAPMNARAAAVGAVLARELRADERVWVVGDAREEDVTALASALPAGVLRAPAPCATPLARWVGWAAMHGRATRDDGTMEPRYVRGSDAKLPGGVSP